MPTGEWWMWGEREKEGWMDGLREGGKDGGGDVDVKVI